MRAVHGLEPFLLRVAYYLPYAAARRCTHYAGGTTGLTAPRAHLPLLYRATPTAVELVTTPVFVTRCCSLGASLPLYYVPMRGDGRWLLRYGGRHGDGGSGRGL